MLVPNPYWRRISWVKGEIYSGNAALSSFKRYMRILVKQMEIHGSVIHRLEGVQEQAVIRKYNARPIPGESSRRYQNPYIA